MSASRAAVLESPPQGQNKRIPRWQRWLFLTAIAFLILMAIGVAVFLLRFPFSRDRVRQTLQETFSGHVAFAQFHATYFPHPGCFAQGLTPVSPFSPDGSPPSVSVRQFT